ncbi:patatin-like phospholipase family protein [Dyadobacter bucti]|uniref:patatin-like phospholipase family protein n=1 Tax=Dyadobacter bucti TaxID=2572203 RepID=UPI00197ADE1A|nr:patatin-like phospholipase family protein [Dyadobacter bucti]
MDVVTDLTAQAVSYLTVIQDVCRNEIEPYYKKNNELSYLLYMEENLPAMNAKLTDLQIKRISEITFCTNPDLLESAESKNDSLIVSSFLEISKNLLYWTVKLIPTEVFNAYDFPDRLKIEDKILFFTPDQWRRNIRTILYQDHSQRVVLAEILHYMPIQVILCLSSKEMDGYEQRICQFYKPGDFIELLSENDRVFHDKWWKGTFHGNPVATFAPELLTKDQELLRLLTAADNPVSFENIFNAELDEIEKSREKRVKDPGNLKSLNWMKNMLPTGKDGWISPKAIGGDGQSESQETGDPIERAQKMKLTGLAFSGGGIRSATFNLGVLQKLAEQDVLPQVDYISTVSGGGYIGSWLVSWIRRAGSVSKVVDRLDTKRSTDPMADEVRPVRWVRMYSNYLTPEASLMSTDSWTAGITWLRNTLINQLILLLLLCTVLSVIHGSFLLWEHFALWPNGYSPWLKGGVSILILITGAGLAGLGMHMFDKEYPSKNLLNYGKNRLFSWALVIWAILSSVLVSIWLYNSAQVTSSFGEKQYIFVVAGVAALIGIVVVAYVGNYHRNPDIQGKRVEIWIAIVASSILATVAGLGLLAAVWSFFEYIEGQGGAGNYISGDNDKFIYKIFPVVNSSKMMFILGIPLILEVFSLTVVVRMLIMGIFFPDVRREWWGRMGAIIHRFILLWIVVTICVLVLPRAFDRLTSADMDKLTGLFGGWAAIVGLGVKLAFSSTSSGENKDKSGFSVKEMFVRFAPYLFILGILLIGSSFLNTLREIILRVYPFQHLRELTIIIVIFAVTFLLSWRAGVNEFSLHHFYRNRLVRAYLGASRRQVSRSKTANSFTGFDKADDTKLDQFTFEKEYTGPYPIINTALNASVVSELDRQDRKAESFIFTPFYTGFDFSSTRSAAFNKNGIFHYGYRPTAEFANGPTIGTAMAISGAAVNPNMGYHSSSLTAFLLTVFNVRLGWWIGNPRLKTWKKPEPPSGLAYIVKDLIGKSDVDSNYVNLSDGGHFDNMGLYELIRRRCSTIILGDAEEDSGATCEGLANAIRRCRIDFGVEITIKTDGITVKDELTKFSKAHIAEGDIKYPEGWTGKLIYIKSALTGDESTDIREYNLQNPAFPQQSTGDQFFDEAQFESYRKLGYHSVQFKA